MKVQEQLCLLMELCKIWQNIVLPRSSMLVPALSTKPTWVCVFCCWLVTKVNSLISHLFKTVTSSHKGLPVFVTEEKGYTKTFMFMFETVLFPGKEENHFWKYVRYQLR